MLSLFIDQVVRIHHYRRDIADSRDGLEVQRVLWFEVRGSQQIRTHGAVVWPSSERPPVGVVRGDLPRHSKLLAQ